MHLKGSSVLLTGGSRGIGPHIARALLARGARVTLAARSADDLEKVKEKLRGETVTVAGDVTDPDDRKRFVAEAEEAFGPIDILVNNAGIESVRHFGDYTQDEMSRIVEVNLDAPLQLCLLVVPGMIQRGRGHVVNVASLAGKAAVPYNTVYAATKHGLIGFTYSLRAELHGTGVSVSAVCPGFVSDDGMFAQWADTRVPKGSGTGTSPPKVAQAVIKAIERDRPDVVVSGVLPRISDVAIAVAPRLSERIARRTGAYTLLRRQADARRTEDP